MKLNLSELKYIINEAALLLLNEISIKQKYDKETQMGKNKLPFELFRKLCEIDPTTTPNKVGKYANWVLAKYNENANMDELRIALEWYADGIKRNVIGQLGISKDINTFKSYDELINTINSIRHSDESQISNSEYNQRQKLNREFEILGRTSTYEIIHPLTYKAERHFGSGTSWCTVGNINYYNSYSRRGKLYILYPKNGENEKKMQFHFESKSFADYQDHVYNTPIACMEKVVENSNELKKLVQLCKRIFGGDERYYMTLQELLLLAKQRLNDGDSLKEVFDYVGDFRNGFAIVILNNKHNLINQNGQLVSDEWFDWIDSFRNGFATVELNGRENFINQEGKLISDEWFSEVGSFNGGFASVRLNGKENFINQEGQFLCDEWFDYVGRFYEGFAIVRLNNKRNFINREGQLISKKWFDDAHEFFDGIAEVQLNNKYYNINREGEIIS